MDEFMLFASPWWVNLLILLPFVMFWLWRRTLDVSIRRLLVAGIFGIAFGFVESSVVVYLRGAIGFLDNRKIILPHGPIPFDVYRQSPLLNQLPKYLLTIEMYRELSTIVMIIAVAMLAHSRWKERWAIFLWIFALWDIFYYVGLKISIGWPKLLTDADVLFLLPVPWLAQVWFPVAVSLLVLLMVFFSQKKYH